MNQRSSDISEKEDFIDFYLTSFLNLDFVLRYIQNFKGFQFRNRLIRGNNEIIINETMLFRPIIYRNLNIDFQNFDGWLPSSISDFGTVDIVRC